MSKYNTPQWSRGKKNLCHNFLSYTCISDVFKILMRQEESFMIIKGEMNEMSFT